MNLTKLDSEKEERAREGRKKKEASELSLSYFYLGNYDTHVKVMH